MDADRLTQLLDEERKRFGVPGLAVALVADGDVALTRGFGHRDAAAAEPVTDKTLFAIASCTKAFTATLLATLVGDGLLDWDTPVREYLPHFRLHDPVASELATVRDLLSHRTGLPRHDLSWYANPLLDRPQIIDRLRHLPSSASFRSTWQYNNLMFLTAGYLAGELLGTSWEQGIRDRLLEPLGMSNTCFSPAEASATADWARAHIESYGALSEVPRVNFPACGPAGSIYSCADDLARWLLLNANDGRIGEREIIAPAALHQTRKPTMPVGDDGPWDEILSVGYGLGWVVEVYRGHRIIQHSGGIDGFSSRVVLVPEKGFGVALLANLDGTGLPQACAYHAIDAALGLEPLPWGERLYDRERSLRDGVSAARSHRENSTSTKNPPTHPSSAYNGRYENPGYGTITVNLDGDTGTLVLGDRTFSLSHRNYDSWIASAPTIEQTSVVTFGQDADGEIDALRAAWEPLVAPIEFRRTSDPALSTPDALAPYTGTYALGTVPVRISIRDGALEVAIKGIAAQRLVPRRPDVFTVEGDSAARVRFSRVDGAVTEAIIEPDQGILRRTQDSQIRGS